MRWDGTRRSKGRTRGRRSGECELVPMPELCFVTSAASECVSDARNSPDSRENRFFFSPARIAPQRNSQYLQWGVSFVSAMHMYLVFSGGEESGTSGQGRSARVRLQNVAYCICVPLGSDSRQHMSGAQGLAEGGRRSCWRLTSRVRARGSANPGRGSVGSYVSWVACCLCRALVSDTSGDREAQKYAYILVHRNPQVPWARAWEEGCCCCCRATDGPGVMDATNLRRKKYKARCWLIQMFS